MPQVIVRYEPTLVTYAMIRTIDTLLSPMVARAASIPGGPQFTLKDIEFYPYENQLGSRAPRLSIEIRTLGITGRIASLNAALVEMKETVLAEVIAPNLPLNDDLLIWLQPISSDGHHV